MRQPLFFEFVRSAGKLGGTGLIFSILLYALAIYEHNAGKNAPASYLVGAGTLSFCWGAYCAWSKERNRYKAEVSKHGNPSFELKLGQIDVSFDAPRNITLILLCPTITNHGATSAANSWQLQYNSPMMRVTVPFTNLPFAISRWWIRPTNQWLLLHQEKMLPVVTAGAVETGHSKSGRLLFDIPGNHAEEIRTNPSRLFVGCSDRMSQMTWQGADQYNVMHDFAVLPGENVDDSAPETLMPPE